MAEGFSRRGMGGFTGGAQMYDMAADPTWAGDFGASTMTTPDQDVIDALEMGVNPAVVAEIVADAQSTGLPNTGHFGQGWLQDFLENLNYSWTKEKERANQKTMDYLVRTGQMPPIEILEEQSTSPMVEALLPQIQTGDVSGGLSVKDARALEQLSAWASKQHSSLATQKSIDAFKNEGLVGQQVTVDISNDWQEYNIDPNKDSTVTSLEKKADKQGLESIINSNQSDWDKQWARNKLLEKVEEKFEWPEIGKLSKKDKKDKKDVLEKVVDAISLGVVSADDEGMEDARLAFPSQLPPLDEIRAQQIIQGDVPTSKSQIEAFEKQQAEIDRTINRLGRPRVKENQLWRELAERNLQADIRRDMVEQPDPLVANIDPNVLNVDLNKAIKDLTRQAELSAALKAETPQRLNQGWPDDLPEYDVPVLEDGRLAGMQEGVYGMPDPLEQIARELTPNMGGMQDRWDDNIPSISASRARTQELNEAELVRTLQDIEARKQGDLEARKQGDLIDQQTQATSQEVLEGLSPAMVEVLQGNPELMDQYLSKRDEIMAMLARITGTTNDPTPGGFTTKTGSRYVSQPLTHEEWYPGSQAAANKAGFWGPLALGWNPKYNEYKDAQRRLMGKQPGERFWSDDWVRNFGWMTPEQINAVIGY